MATLFFPNSSIWTNGYYIIVNWRSIYYYIQNYYFLVWYFNFACFNMTVVKNLTKQFSKCLCSFSTSQFFCSGNPFQKNDGPLSKIQLLCSSLVFLTLNNPSQGQYIIILEYWEAVFYWIKILEKRYDPWKFPISENNV